MLKAASELSFLLIHIHPFPHLVPLSWFLSKKTKTSFTIDDVQGPTWNLLKSCQLTLQSKAKGVRSWNCLDPFLANHCTQ